MEGPAGAEKLKLTLYRAHYVKTSKSSLDLTSKPGWYPDALIPFVNPYTDKPITSGLYRASGVSVGSQSNQSYWADVRGDPEAAAGTYTCSIAVNSAGRKVAEVPVTLTVWNFALPKQRQFVTWYYGFYDIHSYYGLTRAAGENYELLMKRYRDMAFDHGVVPRSQWGGSHGKRDSNTGVVTFDAAYIRQMRNFVAEYGTGIIQIPPSYYMSDPSNFVLFDEIRFKNTIQSYDLLSKDYPDLGQFVVYIDEPRFPEREAAVRQAKDWMNQIPALRVKMLLTGHQYAYDILDSAGKRCADIWICYGPQQNERYAAGRPGFLSLGAVAASFLNDPDNPGAILWNNSAHPLLDADLSSYRDFAWYGYTLGVTGGFGWRLTVPSTSGIDQWTQARTYVQPDSPQTVYNGLTSHIYPGNSARVGFSDIGGPIPSIRLKIWRRACQDFEYFKILEGLAGKAAVDAIVLSTVNGYYTSTPAAEYEAARKKDCRTDFRASVIRSIALRLRATIAYSLSGRIRGHPAIRIFGR